MTLERALIQLIKEKKGRLEYDDDIYYEFNVKHLDIEKLLTLSQQYASKQTQLLVHNFLKK
jgi:hypothetical protein